MYSPRIIRWSFLAALIVVLSLPGYTAETFGAPKSDELGPLGGGKGYKKIVTKGDFLVKTPWELIDALEKAKAGQVVYVDDNADMDMTITITARKKHLIIPAGVTLASGRGYKGSKGALISSYELNTLPLIEAGGNNVRVTGLRLQGPDQKNRLEEMRYMFGHPTLIPEGTTMYAFPVSRGVFSEHKDLEVDNCEIYGFSHSGVYVMGDNATCHVHHCNIHHCQREGLGYGVCIGNGAMALVDANLFDYTRHAIASTGRPGCRYEAFNNVCGEHSTSHVFDMHGSTESKGKLWDGKSIAGEWIKIHHNTFKAPLSSVLIRGYPREGCFVDHNWFVVEAKNYSYAWQVGDYKGNMFIRDNVYGKDKLPCK